MNRHVIAFFGLLIFLVFSACKPDLQTNASNTLTVRLKDDISGLNPVTNSEGSSNIKSWIFQSLINFDPNTLQLAPILIDLLPQKVTIDTGIYAGEPAYQFRIKEAAKWPNGTAITTKDYIFSLKVALNRKIRDNGWVRPYSSIIQDVIPMPSDEKSCIVVIKKDFPNVIAYLGGFELLPAYHYDPNHLLQAYPLKDFVGVEHFDQLWTEHPEITEFANQFMAPKYVRKPDGIVGAGPYRLASWTTNEQIVLVKRKNYWADQLDNKSVLLTGNPDTIIFKLVKDEVATTLMLKNNELDLVADLSEEQFVKLQKDPTVSETHDFYTPGSQAYYLMMLNNRSPKLTKPVRKALALCFDLDQMIQVATSGLGHKVTGPISQRSQYYHPNLQPIQKDIAEAKNQLKKDGWVDINNDGILEKEINGKKVPLELVLMSGNSASVSKILTLVVKEAAAKIGIKIIIQGASLGQILSAFKSHEYDMALVRFTTSPADYAPYSTWHSDSAGKNGRNFSGYSSSKNDSIIMALLDAQTTEEKMKLYYRFQETMYEDQPVIFLFSPTKTIVVNKKWKPLVSILRPGYFAGAFSLRK